MSTVLPTPAPPNSPILPPTTYGVSRSSTLMPVSNISVFDSSWSNGGGSRWIGHRSLMSSSEALTSNGSPRALKTWPLGTSPTGTMIGPPVFCTSAPLTRPSVGCSAIARTMSSPMCWATSRVSVFDSSPRAISVVRAWFSSGMVCRPNSTSTTGPITRTTRPVALLAAPCSSVFSSTAVISLITPCCGEGIGTTDDLADFLGDLRLTSLVRQPGVGPDQVRRVVARRLHRPPARRGLRRRGLQQGGKDPRADVARQQRGHQTGRFRLELVLRRRLLAVVLLVPVLRRLVPCRVHRRDLERGRRLAHRVDEPGVNDPQLVDARPAVLDLPLGGCAERRHHRLRRAARVGELRLLGEPGPRTSELHTPEPVIRDALAADDIAVDLPARTAEPVGKLVGSLDRVGVVAAGQAAVAGDDEDPGPARVLHAGEHRVCQRRVTAEPPERLAELLGVRLGVVHPRLRLDDARSGDELHRLGDLLRRLDGLDPPPVDAKLGAHASIPQRSDWADDW